MNQCHYCDSMKPSFEGANYCSLREDSHESIRSNAFSFWFEQMDSGMHQSRFSIRMVNQGSQLYHVNGRKHLLSQENFLILNDGSTFENQVVDSDGAQGLVVSFNPQFLNEYHFIKKTSNEKLLDNPGDVAYHPYDFYENTYNRSHQLTGIAARISDHIALGNHDELLYNHLFIEILDEITGIATDLEHRIDGLEAVKKSTKEELYRRVSTAKDYIDANLWEKIHLEKIAQVSCMSPFHFLRIFDEFFDETPYQYILRQRLKKSHSLLKNSALSLEQVMHKSGFENRRTFQRAFTKKYGLTPQLYKKMCES